MEQELAGLVAGSVLAESVRVRFVLAALRAERLAFLLEVSGGFAKVLALRVLVGIFDELAGELETRPPSTVQDGTADVPESTAVVDTPNLHVHAPLSFPTLQSASI